MMEHADDGACEISAVRNQQSHRINKLRHTKHLVVAHIVTGVVRVLVAPGGLMRANEANKNQMRFPWRAWITDSSTMDRNKPREPLHFGD